MTARAAVKRFANTPGALIATVVGSWAAFGLSFAAVTPGVGWFDGLYLGSVVQSTLGFGDVLPTNVAGKLLVMGYVWFCIYFLLPAAIYHFGQAFLEDPDEVTDDDLAITNAKLDRLQADLTSMREALALVLSLDARKEPSR